VALGDRDDSFHAWAVAKFQTLREPPIVCRAVLTEATHLLRRFSPALVRMRALLEAGRLLVADEPSPAAALRLMERYANVPMSFADACLTLLAELSSETRIFTVDRDFTVYRRADGGALSLIAPFVE
jgi:predicted nucleic acid-binding protein